MVLPGFPGKPGMTERREAGNDKVRWSMTGGEVLIEEEKQVRPAEINGKRMSAGEV